MYFENYLKNKNDQFSQHYNANPPTINYQLTQPIHINRLNANTNMPNNHKNLNIQTMDQSDHFKYAQNHYPIQHDFKKNLNTPTSPINSNKIITASKFQPPSTHHYANNKPHINEDRRFANHSPIKINQRISTSIGRQENMFCRYERRSQSISSNQPKFGQHFKLNSASNCVVVHQNNQYQPQPPIVIKNGINPAQNNKFNSVNPSPQIQTPLISHNPGYYGHIGRKSSNLSNESSTQALTNNQEQYSETTPIKQQTIIINNTNKYMKNLQNLSLEKFSTNYLSNTDRRCQNNQNPDKINQMPKNTFYQYKKKQVQQLNNRLQSKDNIIENSTFEKTNEAMISFYQYKKMQEEKNNSISSFKQLAEFQSQASTMDKIDKQSSEHQNCKFSSPLPQQITNQLTKNNFLSETKQQKTTKSQLFFKNQNRVQKDKTKQLQFQLQSKIKQIYEKNKQIFDKNKQIIQKNRQIECLTNEIKQYKQTKSKTMNTISQNIRIKQITQKYNKQINNLKLQKQQLIIKLTSKQSQYLQKSNNLIKSNNQLLLQNQHKINQLISNLSSTNFKNKQLLNQISNKQKQINNINIHLQQNNKILQQTLQKINKLEECQYVIHHLSNKIKQYQNTIKQQKCKNNQKICLINQLNKKLNQSYCLMKRNQNQFQQNNLKKTQIVFQIKKQLQQSLSVNNQLKQLLNQKNTMINCLNHNIAEKNNIINNLNKTICQNNDGMADMNAKITEFVQLINIIKKQKYQMDAENKHDEELLKQKDDKLREKDGQIQMSKNKIQQIIGQMQVLDNTVKSLLSKRKQQLGSQFIIQHCINYALNNITGQSPYKILHKTQNDQYQPPKIAEQVLIKKVEDKQIQVQLIQPALIIKQQKQQQQQQMIPKQLYDQLQRRFQQLNRELKKVSNKLNILTIQFQNISKLNNYLNQQLIIINAININQKYRQLQQQLLQDQ